MTKINKIITKYKQGTVYIIFGVFTTLVNLIAFLTLEHVFGDVDSGYVVYNAIAWIVSVVFAYVTNKLYVFGSKSWAPRIVLKESVQFLLARVFSFLVEEFGLIFLVEFLKLGQCSLELKLFTLSGVSVVKILLLCIVIIMNYFFSKFMVFKK